MITTSIVFDHRNRTRKGDEGPIEIRIIVGRKPYYINTGVRVREKQFAFDRVVCHPQCDVLNARIGILMHKVLERVNAVLEDGTDLDIAALRKELWNITDKEENVVVPWLIEQTALLDVADATRKRYKVLTNRLEEYGKFKVWSDIDISGIYDFDKWLHSRRKPQSKVHEATGMKPELIGDGAIYNYHKCLRYMLNRACRLGVISSNPYSRMRGELKRGDCECTEYLTDDEMAAIEALHPTPGTQLAMARDLFVFQMYTGLSYSDTQTFDINNYKRVKGKWCIVNERIKTKVPYVNQLLPPAVAVLEANGMQTPKMSNVKYNAALKTLGTAIGIRTPLHSHLARHTFATFMLRNGVKIENLSKMLGHTNIKQTQRYAKVLAQSVHNDFDMIAQKWK